jgi:hypothetical protein
LRVLEPEAADHGVGDKYEPLDSLDRRLPWNERLTLRQDRGASFFERAAKRGVETSWKANACDHFAGGSSQVLTERIDVLELLGDQCGTSWRVAWKLS